MHFFPCSALLACFGNTRENAAFDQSSSADTHSTINVQPMAKAGRHPSHPKVEEERASEKRRDSDMHSEQNGGANGNNSKHNVVQPAETLENVPRCLSDEPDREAVTFQTSIPRPSIIDTPKVMLHARAITGYFLLPTTLPTTSLIATAMEIPLLVLLAC
ncbi:putative protein FAM107B isoform X1 [Microtus ochrogaster]|uniref:Uncharacterized protein n=1 Tax=Microtus ochrogaster TaxID=79684 RepID=A0A8J6G5G5_MICOH|nr:putative protein FAM107B isoform X1 [Microtus ochrogaster]